MSPTLWNTVLSGLTAPLAILLKNSAGVLLPNKYCVSVKVKILFSIKDIDWANIVIEKFLKQNKDVSEVDLVKRSDDT